MNAPKAAPSVPDHRLLHCQAFGGEGSACTCLLQGHVDRDGIQARVLARVPEIRQVALPQVRVEERVPRSLQDLGASRQRHHAVALGRGSAQLGLST